MVQLDFGTTQHEEKGLLDTLISDGTEAQKELVSKGYGTIRLWH